MLLLLTPLVSSKVDASSRARAFPLPFELVTDGAEDGEVALEETVAGKVVVEADEPGRNNSVKESDIEVEGPPALPSLLALP